MLSKHGALTGIKRIASTACLFTSEGTCIYYATKNKEAVLVPGCFISTTLLSPSVTETSSSTETKNGLAHLPTAKWVEARVLRCNFFFGLQVSPVEERSLPAHRGAFTCCPLTHACSGPSQQPLLYLPQKEHQKSYFEMSQDRTSVCVIPVGKTIAECFQEVR